MLYLLLLKRESEFLFMKLKYELEEHINTHGSKRIQFIREEESIKLSVKTLRGVKSPPKCGDYSGFVSLSVLISSFFDWLLFLNPVISNQSV